jgi:tetratricopeptide (TPR) repeat protein
MAELAYFASVTARNLSPEVYGAALVADLQARAWAELANADRVNDQLEQADAEFSEARRLLKMGSGNPLVRARVADLEASLRRAQRRMPQALALLDEARRLYAVAGDSHLAGKATTQKGMVSYYEGDPHRASKLFRQGLALLDRERDPHLVATTYLSLIRSLAKSGELTEAGRLLLSSGLREAFSEEPLILLKLRWIEGAILAGRGQHHRAEEVLSEVRTGFKGMEQEYDAALVGLELAEFWLQQGKLDAVQALATDTLFTFRRLKIDVHALAAVQFLAECCRRKILSAKILSHVRDFLGRFQQNPHLRFEYSG